MIPTLITVLLPLYSHFFLTALSFVSLYRSCCSASGRHSDTNMTREADTQEIRANGLARPCRCASKHALHPACFLPEHPLQAISAHRASISRGLWAVREITFSSQSLMCRGLCSPLAFKRGKKSLQAVVKVSLFLAFICGWLASRETAKRVSVNPQG